MSKVLVTGATGFTGSNLCRRLVREGHQVSAFVRQSSRTGELEEAGVECRVVDITNPVDVRDNFSDVQYVYNIAL